MYVGTVTISVFKNSNDDVDFKINTDNDDVLPVSYVIEDTLKLYQTNFQLVIFFAKQKTYFVSLANFCCLCELLYFKKLFS